MTPGMHFNIPNEEYHKGVGISKSGLDLVAVSPLHYWDKYLRPRTDEEKEAEADRKKHFVIGEAIHTAILEPKEFGSRYFVLPSDAPRKPTSAQRNAKKPSDDTLIAIDYWDAIEATGQQILKAGERDVCMAVAEQVRSSRIGKRVFAEHAFAEVSAFWEDAETGVLCKCRPDLLVDPTGLPVIVDVKSTKSAHPDEFARSAWNYNYHVAAAWYLDGVLATTGLKPDSFLFLATEKESPFAFAWYWADEGMVEAGRREYRRLLNIYADCLHKNEWPGYPDQLQPLSLPEWAQRQLGMGGEA